MNKSKIELSDLKQLIILSVQGWKYYYLQRQNNINNEENYQQANNMLMRIEDLLIDATRDIIPPESFHSLLSVESEREATAIINNIIMTINKSELLNNPSLMSDEKYDEIAFLYGSLYMNGNIDIKTPNEFALTVLAAGSLQAYKPKIEAISGPNLSFNTNEYRVDLNRGELKTEQELSQEFKVRSEKIYNNSFLPIEEKKDLIKAINFISMQYMHEINRIKSIEDDPYMDYVDPSDRDLEEASRNVHL